MNRMKIAIVLGAVLVLGVAMAWMTGMLQDRVAPGDRDVTLASAAGVTHTVTTSRVPVFETVPATISASEQTLVSARLLARITAISVRGGQTVEQGDLLVSLEQSDLKAAVERAEEQVNSLLARVDEAASNRQRAESLFAEKVLSVADLERATAQFDTLSADLAAARLSLTEARTALGYTRIHAPISGKVVERLAEPGDTALPGQAILGLYNPTSLQAEAQVREHIAVDLSAGQRVEITVPSLNQTVSATLTELIPAANPGSRSFTVKAAVAFDKKLQPGMYAQLSIPVGEKEKILIPPDMVSRIGQLDVVHVMRDDATVRRFIRLGEAGSDGQIEVVSGLKPGEVITAPRT